MTLIALALSMLLQQEGWQETSFHRIHLRNGNFIDGKVIADKPNEVILLLKAGEMSVRRDQIDFVELIKLRSYNEKPAILATPKNPATTPTTPTKPKTPDSTPSTTPTVEVDTPDAVRSKVDQLVYKFRNQPGPEKFFPTEELRALGDSAVAYLATRVPEMDVTLADYVMQAMIVLKTTAANQVLSQLLSHDKPTVRSFAATVLGVQGDEEKKRYVKPLLRDPDPRVRATALSMAGSVQDPEWFEPVSELCADEVKDVRGPALVLSRRLAVRNGLQERLLRVLGANLSSPSAEVKSDAAGTIGGLQVKGSWIILAPALADRETSVRAAAANSLLQLAEPECGPAVVEQISRETEKEPNMALLAIVLRLRLHKATESVINLLKSGDPDVRTAAENTLRTMSGENFGSDVDAWTAWYSKNKK